MSIAQAELAAAPDDVQRQAAVQAAEKGLDTAKKDLRDKQNSVQSAQAAFGTPKTNSPDHKADGAST